MAFRRLLPVTVLAFTSASAFALQATPPCEGWNPNFHRLANASVPDGPVYASAIFDDGSGPKLYIGGQFTRVGNVQAWQIACWDGTSWSALGSGWSPEAPAPNTAASVRALAVYDDGSGPALYAAGSFHTGPLISSFTNFARWNGTDWSIPGGGVTGSVLALAVHNDGAGPKLYAAGLMSAAGGQAVGNIASWDGTAWAGLGTGMPIGNVTALASYGDGGARQLYACGQFIDAGGTPVKHIARWDGAAWSGVAGGITSMPVGGKPLSLHVHDDGNESKLILGGYFSQVDGIPVNNVAAWNGTNWSALGPGLVGDVRTMTTWNDGSGTALYAGGYLSPMDASAFGLVRWNGTTWSSVGDGVATAAVQTLRVHDDGSGERLLVGGQFSSVGGGAVTGTFAAWDGASWSAVGTPPQAKGLNGIALAFAAHDDGSGRALYAGGGFSQAGGQTVNHVARWNGTAWSALGTGLAGGNCAALASYDLGGGSELFAAGTFTSAGGAGVALIASWNGTSWIPTPGLSGGMLEIRALQGFDDGSGRALYVAGNFATSIAPQMFNIGRWNGTAWSALGTGIGGGNGRVNALAVYDSGSGPTLYAAGQFNVADGVAVANIARWTGTTWAPVGGGVGVPGGGDSVHALCVYDDGSGPALYAGGEFSEAGGVPAAALARWNGTSWSALPLALAPSPAVYSLCVVDDGNGAALSVGGRFAAAGTESAFGVARWNGTAWSGYGAGIGGANTSASGYGHPNIGVVYAQLFHDDGAGGGADLYVGGAFDTAGGHLSTWFARYDTCAETFTNFCAGDGLGASTCPCANYGAPSHGCSTSANPNGGLLAASGVPSVSSDSAVLAASELPPAFATIVQGSLQGGGGLGIHFGDGLLCVGGTITRIATRFATGGNLNYPAMGDTALALAGGLPLQGGSRTYQVWYRDSQLGFCMPGTFNLTNGVRCIWVP